MGGKFQTQLLQLVLRKDSGTLAPVIVNGQKGDGRYDTTGPISILLEKN
jgi:hypothetical protein